MKKSLILASALFLILATGCDQQKPREGQEEVPTTLEQSSSSLSSSSSDSNVSTGHTNASASSSSSSSGAPTAFSFSTRSISDTAKNLTNIRDLVDNKEVRDLLQKEAIKLLIADGFIESAEEKINLIITNELVMINKKLMDDKQAEKYVALLKANLTMGDVFNYSFNQY